MPVPSAEPAVFEPGFLELYDHYVSSMHARLIKRVLGLSPRRFERFARKLLAAYGFFDLHVTAVGKDASIDGHGQLRLGLATMHAAFQCKKWNGSVDRPEVDKFRGAIQGSFEQGVFFTTSDFTPEARDASLRRGAVPIILLNGESIVSLMIEKELGVQRVPLHAYYERPADFSDIDEDNP